MMNDFAMVINMLSNSNTNFRIDYVEGEHPGICVPSCHPENYTAGVCFSFNDDGSLFAVHAYEPDEDEEIEG